MRVLIAALGSRGDVQPGLALALALRRAGHEAVVSAPPDFSAWSAQLGVPFVACDDASIEALLKANLDDVGSNPLRVMRLLAELVHQHIPLILTRTLAVADG